MIVAYFFWATLYTQLARTQHRQLRSPNVDALVSAVFGALSDNALYKLTLTLTLTLPY